MKGVSSGGYDQQILEHVQPQFVPDIDYSNLCELESLRTSLENIYLKNCLGARSMQATPRGIAEKKSRRTSQSEHKEAASTLLQLLRQQDERTKKKKIELGREDVPQKGEEGSTNNYLFSHIHKSSGGGEDQLRQTTAGLLKRRTIISNAVKAASKKESCKIAETLALSSMLQKSISSEMQAGLQRAASLGGKSSLNRLEPLPAEQQSSYFQQVKSLKDKYLRQLSSHTSQQYAVGREFQSLPPPQQRVEALSDLLKEGAIHSVQRRTSPRQVETAKQWRRTLQPFSSTFHPQKNTEINSDPQYKAIEEYSKFYQQESSRQLRINSTLSMPSDKADDDHRRSRVRAATGFFRENDGHHNPPVDFLRRFRQFKQQTSLSLTREDGQQQCGQQPLQEVQLSKNLPSPPPPPSSSTFRISSSMTTPVDVLMPKELSYYTKTIDRYGCLYLDRNQRVLIAMNEKPKNKVKQLQQQRSPIATTSVQVDPRQELKRKSLFLTTTINVMLKKQTAATTTASENTPITEEIKPQAAYSARKHRQKQFQMMSVQRPKQLHLQLESFVFHHKEVVAATAIPSQLVTQRQSSII